MARSGEGQEALARVYAAAILQLADEKGQAEAVGAELQELQALGQQVRELGEFFIGTPADVHVRAKTIDRLFRGQVSDILLDSMQIINRKDRLALLPAIVEAYRRLFDARCGKIDVEVQTAVALEEPLRADLLAWSKQYTAKQPTLRESVDPSLLGGLIVRIGDLKFDMAVSTRLASLEDRLMERASLELYEGKTYLA